MAVALLVLLLLALLVGLLGPGPGATQPAAPAASTPSSSAASGGGSASPGARGTASGRPTAPATDPETGLRLVALADLPVQARQTVALIDQGGPFPYAQDGATFGNYEGHLPAQARGWYREYTVRTPGERDRGPRRIVTGDDDRLLFYTADHYDSFVRVAR